MGKYLNHIDLDLRKRVLTITPGQVREEWLSRAPLASAVLESLMEKKRIKTSYPKSDDVCSSYFLGPCLNGNQGQSDREYSNMCYDTFSLNYNMPSLGVRRRNKKEDWLY